VNLRLLKSILKLLITLNMLEYLGKAPLEIYRSTSLIARLSLLRFFITSVNYVRLTSDIWSGNAKEDYISVVAHYIKSDRQVEKRVLDLVLIDVSHNGHNIADHVASVLTDYGLTEKVLLL
jgi:hypothetical protein